MDIKRIATEEAFSPPEMMDAYRGIIREQSVDDPGFYSLWGHYLTSDSERPRAIRDKLIDLDGERLADMDATGIHHQVISLTSPGVQVLERDLAVNIATLANDRLAEAVARHPDRYTGLAAMAPQDPPAAAREIERGVTRLGFKGVILNSHTQGEYFDDRKFWEIFEVCEQLDVPVYLHPNTPSKAMIDPLLESGLDGAIFGFAVETGMHLLRIIVSGAFDRFPGLKIVVGHLGEALPFWLFRLDFMHGAMVRANRYPTVRPLKKKISDYMRENVWITTSGMAWEPAIMFVRSVIGNDRVMYAMDYPYQFVPAEVEVTDNLPISDAEKQAFYQTNAEKLFSINKTG
ncbi:MAG: amidohydrolase family protein [Gammaproteobacteria bacterium]|nr:amidohydrolase family protein [Gammaproteobacteria bacterium]MDH4253312.1 amidohydrolase family protein [Gammaproteobacteria bacterium]